MAGIASLPRTSAREPVKFSPSESRTNCKQEVSDGEKEDTGESTVEELEGLLKQYTDRDKRVKIRETIRLLKQSLQEGETSPVETQKTPAAHTSTFSTRTDRSIQQDNTVSPVEFSVSLQKTPASSSLSRFTARSTSLRNQRPSYQPPAQAVNRANSFKLSRPKDFILQKVGSSPQLTKVPESAPEDFKEYADSLNNNVPKYTKVSETVATRNKSASPFSATPHTPFTRKQIWTPPSKSTQQNPTSTETRSAPPSILRRSESTKENRSSDIQPVAVVHGNIRRSKSILGRILGQKIESEKPLFKPSFIAPSPEYQKPPVHSTPKSESPTPAPRNKKHIVEKESESSSSDSIAPTPQRRTVNSSPKELENTEVKGEKSRNKAEKFQLEKSRSLSSSSSESSSSSSEGGHVYEVAGSDSDVSSSESSDHSREPTLSEIIQATREHHDNETSSVPLTEPDQTSFAQKSENCDQSEELESEKLSDDEKKLILTENTEVFLEGTNEYSNTTRVVLDPLESHAVVETEQVQLFHVQIVRPIGPRPPATQSNVTNEKKNNKETRKLSSSSSSTTLSSASDNDDDILSDDEESNSEDENMDRYSSRALQSRVSVKSQISAKEDDVNANTTAKTPASRRLRERHNKPLNTGDDLRSRIQKYKGQLNGEATTEKKASVKRNGSAKVTVSASKKLDISKFEKSGDDNVKVHSTAQKTTITLSTTAPKSTTRSISREDKPSNKENTALDGSKPYQNGSTSPSDDNDKEKARNLSSSSATDDSSRARRARRAKLNSENESGADKLERASKTTTKELKDLHSSNYSSDFVITTKSSRERTKNAAEDVNNNTKSMSVDAAPSNENVEAVVEDSLSSWSARRRKRREQKSTPSSATASGTDNEKSTEETTKIEKDTEEEEVKEAKKTLKHVTHSAPALAEMGQSLSGYTVKLTINGNTKLQEEAENKEVLESKDVTKGSRVRGRYSRSSENRSSTSSANSEVEKPHDAVDNTATSPVEDEPVAKVVMVIVDDDVAIDDAEDQSREGENDVTELEDENERMSDAEEQKESEEEDGLEEKGERNSVQESEEPAEGSVCENEAPAQEEPELNDEIITENKGHSEDESTVTQTNTDEQEIYKSEEDDAEPQNEAQLEIEASAVEASKSDTEQAPPPEPEAVEPIIEPEPESAAVPKETPLEPKEITDEQESEKPRRRHRRKRDEETGDKPVDAREEPTKPRNRRHERKKEESEKVETKGEKLPEKSEIGESYKEEEKQDLTPEVKTVVEDKTEEKEAPAVTETKSVENKAEKEEAKSEEKPKEKKEEEPKTMHVSYDNIEEISDIKVLEKMLEGAFEYDQRRRIRSVIRALKRGEKPEVVKDPKYEAKSNGSLPQKNGKESRITSTRTRVTRTEKTELGSKYTTRTERTTTTRMTSGQKKIGSIFDRGDDEEETRKSSKSSGSSRMADLERRQAERRRELQRNRSMPATSSKDARKAFVAKLESSAPKTQQAKKVGRSPTFVVPNANNVKQLLLKWCQSKTRGYEHVDIMNFSSSWASGMAFCALVHNFFPDAFDYSKLDPKNRAENLSLAFTKAEEIADIAPLLEVEDMLIMGNRPDSKCIFTYVQFMYNHLKKYDQPLVPIKDGQESGGSGKKLEVKKMVETEDL